MSSEAIIEEIRREAEERVAAVRKETEERKKAIREEAEKEAKAGYDAVMKAGLKEIRDEKRRQISLANMQAREVVRKAKEKGIANCFFEAERRISEISSSGNYPPVLALLINEAKKEAGESRIAAAVRREDRDLVTALIPDINGLYLSDEEIRDAGVVVYADEGNIRIDQTFSGRMKRMKKKLAHETAMMLYDRL